MCNERETMVRRRISAVILVLIMVTMTMFGSPVRVSVHASTVSSESEDGSGQAGVLSAKAGTKPGKVSFLYARTYKARKGLSKKKYNKNLRLVVLYWTRASNAGKYQIWYSYKKNGSYKKAVKKPVAGTASGTYLSCKLSYKSNKLVYFKITPYNGATAGPTSSWISVKAGNTKKNVKSVRLAGGNASLYVGDVKKYTASVTPAKPVTKGVRWMTSNASVAKVDSAGRVTAVNIGSAIIYAIAHDGIKSSARVTVNKVNAPQISVSWGIKSSKISWTAVSGVDGYEVHSQIGKGGTDVMLASVNASVRSWTDTYYNTTTKTVSPSLKSKPSYLKYTYFLDPTVNPLVYSVRAFKTVSGKRKYSAYTEDFHLETPTIASASSPSGGKVTLTFGKSTMADGYYIYNGDGSNWYRIATAGQSSSVKISKSVAYDSSKPYYTVKAYASKNGLVCNSGYDKTFHIDGKNYTSKKVLFMGDSIAFGTPYTGVSSESDPYFRGSGDAYGFSYPRRFFQLTGAQVTNVSVAGATYTYIDSNSYPDDKSNYSNTDGRRSLTITKEQWVNADKTKDNSYGNMSTAYNYDESVESLRKGSGGLFKDTIDKTSGSSDKNPGRFSDYDVIILAAGTNDAKRCSNLGMGIGDYSISNTDNTNFAGAVNRILTYIEEANQTRISNGKSPIQVVYIDLFYRADISNGKTVVDQYQKGINQIVKNWGAKWTGSSDPKIHQFHHNYLTADNALTLSSDYLHLTRYSQGQFGSLLADYLISNGILTK